MTPTRKGINGAVCTHDLIMVLVIVLLQHQKCHLKFALKYQGLAPFLRLVRMQTVDDFWTHLAITPKNTFKDSKLMKVVIVVIYK